MFKNYTLIDLTHTLSKEAPTWNGSCGFFIEIKKDYEEMFRVQQIKLHAGVGTHMDAPSHRFQDGLSIDELELEDFIADLCVINVTKKAHADYAISLEDVTEYESRFGKIPERAFVIGFTGWSRFWKQSDAYRNLDAQGQRHFPSFSKEAAAYLLECQVVGIGIDTLSPDCLDLKYPVHRLMLGKGKYIIENVADCQSVPPKGAKVLALPLKLKGATECPVRLIALIPKGK